MLKWLAQKFESDRTYPERELNAIIKPIHSDTATLRRELLGYDMMQSENSINHRTLSTQWRVDLDCQSLNVMTFSVANDCK